MVKCLVTYIYFFLCSDQIVLKIRLCILLLLFYAQMYVLFNKYCWMLNFVYNNHNIHTVYIFIVLFIATVLFRFQRADISP